MTGLEPMNANVIAFPVRQQPVRAIDPDQRDEVKALCALMSCRIEKFRASVDADERAINECIDGVQFTISELARMIERYEEISK